MSRFHTLAIARVEKETRDAVAITFAVPDALRDAFRHEPGQHLTLKADIAGQDVRRSYSICSAKDEGVLRIAIKRAPGGVFSTWANEREEPIEPRIEIAQTRTPAASPAARAPPAQRRSPPRTSA